MFGESQYDSCRQMRTKVQIESTAPFGPDIFTVRPHSSVIGNRKVIVNRRKPRPHSSCVIFTTMADDNEDVGLNPNKLVQASRLSSATSTGRGSVRMRLKRKLRAKKRSKSRDKSSVTDVVKEIFSEIGETDDDSYDSDFSNESSRNDRRRAASSEYFDDPGFDIDDTSLDTDLDVSVVFPVSDFSSARVYKDSCKRFGVTPASYFLRHLDDPALIMRHHGLGPKGAKPIAITLVSNPTITKLDLTDNWLCDEGGIYISDMLKENIHITELVSKYGLSDLSYNKLGSSFTQTLKHSLQRNTSINSLTLRGNQLSDVSAIHIASIIQSTVKLQKLDLTNNDLNVKAGQHLGSAFKDNATIKYLFLGRNCLTHGADSIFDALLVNDTLEEIDLSHNGIRSKSLKILNEVLKVNTVLTDINLCNNRIQNDGAVLLVKGLAVNENLLTLKLARNQLKTDGCLAIIGSVFQNASSILQFIDFGDTFVDNVFLSTLTELKQLKPDIEVAYYGDHSSKQKNQQRGGHPMSKLRRFMERKNMKLVDFFNKLDTDGSMSISRNEFLSGIELLEISLTDTEKMRLLNYLDKDGDGEIDYSELAISHEEEE